MIRIGLCDYDIESAENLKEILLDFTKVNNTIMVIDIFSSPEEMEKSENIYDVYGVRMDWPNTNGLEIAKDLYKLNSEIKIVFLNDKPSLAVESYKVNASGYLLSPYRDADVFNTIIKLRKEVRNQFLVVQTSEGEMRIMIDDLLYINIEGRNLTYHLKDKNLYGPAMRKAFKVTIFDFLQCDSLIFLKPSLLVNQEQVYDVGIDFIQFDNGQTLYVSRPQAAMLIDTWKKSKKNKAPETI